MVKKITIPCIFGSGKSAIDFYIGDPKPEDHPIKHQTDWLSNERGGTVPADVMDAIEKLHDLALKNNVPFEELCYYAINKAEEEKTGGEKEIFAPENKIENQQQAIAQESEGETIQQKVVEEKTITES